MATQVPAKRSRAPWILVGGLGCLVLCLFFVLVAGGLYAVVGRIQPTPVARELPTMIAPATPMPLATTVARPSPIAGGLPTVSTLATPMPLATTVAGPSPIITPTTTSRVGRIAYIAGQRLPPIDQPNSIYVMNVDGSQKTLIAERMIVSSYLFWSPDGTRMVFDALSNAGASSIYLVNADGTKLTGLTNCTPFTCKSPSWSPDGKRIAFEFESRESFAAGPQLAIMNADGSQITPLASAMGLLREITWSPDGKRIALQDSCRSLRVITMEGAVSRALTECGGLAEIGYPAWSPDGKQIAFNYQRSGGGGFGLYVINVDGSQLARLAGDLAVINTSPAWSPDGKRIAFAHLGKNQEGAISLVNPDGSGVIRLTSPDVRATEPAWSPDGRQIAFTFFPFGPGQTKSDIYVMNADGTGVARLTNEPAGAFAPAWQLVGR